ncbi:MAG TPA: hypothetical protein VI461_11930 [Chitinophagaceae bacterium]|nr:hypothetical protein [Chitinophagaceae bacterium]
MFAQLLNIIGHLTLAAMKKVLYDKRFNARIFVADIGIPESAYKKFGIAQPVDFFRDGILQVDFDNY